MKILYDIAYLGENYELSIGKAGIFRVVKEIAIQLVTARNCSTSFCVSNNFSTLEKSMDYCSTVEQFRHTSIITPRAVEPKRRMIDRIVHFVNACKAVAARKGGSFYTLCRRPYQLIKPFIKALIGVEVVPQINEPSSPLPLDQLSQFNIYHSPYHPIPEQIRDVKSLCRFITVHDLIPAIYPQFFTEENTAFFKRILGSIKSDDWVICVSESTRQDLLKHITIDPSRVFVVHSAADKKIFHPCADAKKITETKEKYKIPDKPYLLSVCTLEPRKNMAAVIRAFSHMAGTDELCLVLAGAKGWHYDEIFEEASRDSRVRQRIYFPGFVEDEDLAALYSGAQCFLYPSFYEGFGLPVLEAMQCGTPVITSNISSMPELVGDAGLLVSPHDEAALLNAITRIVSDPSLRKDLSLKSIERSKHFNWEKACEDLLQAYRTALDLNRKGFLAR